MWLSCSYILSYKRRKQAPFPPPPPRANDPSVTFFRHTDQQSNAEADAQYTVTWFDNEKQICRGKLNLVRLQANNDSKAASPSIALRAEGRDGVHFHQKVCWASEDYTRHSLVSKYLKDNMTTSTTENENKENCHAFSRNLWFQTVPTEALNVGYTLGRTSDPAEVRQKTESEIINLSWGWRIKRGSWRSDLWVPAKS